MAKGVVMVAVIAAATIGHNLTLHCLYSITKKSFRRVVMNLLKPQQPIY
ncbi:MAG: hypothetical protein ACI90U_001901 [Pseudomonadales bacterium]|jgi:hypothetical protein